MPDRPESGQSGSEIKTMPMLERVRYRNATVPDWDVGCHNADASNIDFDAGILFKKETIFKKQAVPAIYL